MRIIKRLDLYLLKKFLLVFAGAFFICLFVFMMQFTWRYVDELIGKGLSVDILAQFFWYMGITLVPQALPLGLLLASLITFGNLGETFELLAMKAAGIPLFRIMRPLMLVALLMTGVSFYFQNFTSPQAQKSLRTLLISMKQQSPAVEIPEGVFYNGVPNINLFGQKKNAETGIPYQLIIYKTDQGFDRAQIVLADSGKMVMTNDKLHLVLHLWNGEQCENLQKTGGTQMMANDAHQPFDRETFRYKQFIIDFDANFNMLDKDLLSNMPAAKSMRQIEHSVDSMEHEQDSIGRLYYADARRLYFRAATLPQADSVRLIKQLKSHPVPFDSLLARADVVRLQAATAAASAQVRALRSELEWKGMSTLETDNSIRRHWVEWHQKMTLSLACLLFFFIGAPLGAIIRKGGLGLPTVISVIIFIVWYVINTSSMKMARDGNISMFFGMWVSTMIITPFAVFITYKSNGDSTVFNLDAYLHFMRRLLGIPTKRHLFAKEVIIDEVRPHVVRMGLEQLRAACVAYNAQHRLIKAPGYVQTFFRYEPDTEVEHISEQMEALVEELSNSRDYKVLGVVNEFPYLYTTAHTSPFHQARYNKLAGIFFPLGIVLWFRIWRFRLRLLRDLRITVRTCDRLMQVMDGTASTDSGGSGAEVEEAADNEKRRRRRRMVKWALLVVILALLVRIGITSWQKRPRRAATPERTEQAAPAATPNLGPAPRTLTLPAKAPGVPKQ